MRSPLLLQLQRNRFVNSLIKRLAIHRIADWILGIRPLVKKTPGGLRYKVRSVASMVASNEIFDTGMYSDPLKGQTIHRFVDLGCNVGYVPILLAELAGHRNIEGIAIDGNQTVINETNEHLKDNTLDKVEAILGLAGFEDTKAEADFHINPSSHIASTATGVLNPDVPSAGRSVKVTVPCINVERVWQKRFGDARIDLLKVDIEGMELALFRNSEPLLARTNRVLFEWHKWQVNIDECSSVLVQAGFSKPRIIWEDSQHGLAYCDRAG